MEIIENRYTHFGAFLSVLLLFAVTKWSITKVLNYFSLHRFSARFPLNCQLSFLRVRYSRLNSMLWICTRVFQRFRLFYARSFFFVVVRLEFVFVRVINWICWFFLSFSETIPYYRHARERNSIYKRRATRKSIRNRRKFFVNIWSGDDGDGCKTFLFSLALGCRCGLPFFRWIRLFAPVSLYFI